MDGWKKDDNNDKEDYRQQSIFRENISLVASVKI